MKNKFIKIYILVIAFMITASCSKSSHSNDENSINEITGRVVDGPIKNATCFIDLNGNNRQESNEPTATSNEQGYYTIPYDNNNVERRKTILICKGGTDTITNISLNTLVLKTVVPQETSQIAQTTPLTTLITATSNASIQETVLANLGLSEKSVHEILTEDFWEQSISEQNNIKERTAAQKIISINYQLITKY